jgi:hypothetical protein
VANVRFVFYDVRQIYYGYVVHPLNIIGLATVAIGFWLFRELTQRGLLGAVALRLLALYIPVIVVTAVFAWFAEPDQGFRRVLLLVLVNIICNLIAAYIFLDITPPLTPQR